MPPPLGFITKSSPKLSCVHNLNWLEADIGEVDPQPPAPQVSTPQPEEATKLSNPVLIW